MVATFCSAVIVMTPSLPRPCRTTRRLNLVGPPRDRKTHTTAHPHQAFFCSDPAGRSRVQRLPLLERGPGPPASGPGTGRGDLDDVVSVVGDEGDALIDWRHVEGASGMPPLSW